MIDDIESSFPPFQQGNYPLTHKTFEPPILLPGNLAALGSCFLFLGAWISLADDLGGLAELPDDDVAFVLFDGPHPSSVARP